MTANASSGYVKKYLQLNIMLVSDIQRFSLNKFKNIADSLYKISEKLLNDIIYWQYSDDKFEN